MTTEKELEHWAEEQTERENQRALSGKPQTTGSDHFHDYANAKRIGRAHHVCPECGADITLELVMMAECGFDLDNPNN